MSAGDGSIEAWDAVEASPAVVGSGIDPASVERGGMSARYLDDLRKGRRRCPGIECPDPYCWMPGH